MADRRGVRGRLDAVVTLAGLVCLTGALAGLGGALSERLDLAANFAPLWLGAGGLVLAYGLPFARSRRALVLTTGGTAIVIAGALMIPEFVRPIPTAPGESRTLRIIQFNTWDENVAVSTTADWIAAQQPDVVVVEEAQGPIGSALAARGFVVTRGFGHTAIFSRAAPIVRPAPLAAAEWHLMPPFARATFESAGLGDYTVVGAHMPRPVFGVAAPQRLMLGRMLRRYDATRLIVAGDFNLTPWSFGLRELDASLGLTRVDRAVWSWPARLDIHGSRLGTPPFLPIDHVYVGPGWRLVRVRRGPALGSDHFPLVVDLSAGG